MSTPPRKSTLQRELDRGRRLMRDEKIREQSAKLQNEKYSKVATQKSRSL